MEPYHKIPNVFKRDPVTNTILHGQYSDPVFDSLASTPWVFTEKLDGMNIRIKFDGKIISVAGKSDRAQIKEDLVQTILAKCPVDLMAEKFPEGVCLYGEGIGPKIQAGGGRYGEERHFALFDVKIGHFWLKRGDVEGIADMLGFPVAPYMGTWYLFTAVSKVMGGLYSKYKSSVGYAEGLIGVPSDGLLRRDGSRIIVKIKQRDFFAGYSND